MSDLTKYHDYEIEQRPVNYIAPAKSGSPSTFILIMSILRRWYLVLLIIFIMSAVGVPAIWLSIKPVYSVTGAIRVAPFLEDIITGEPYTGSISYQSFMYTLPEIIMSGQMVQKVADYLKDENLTFFENEAVGTVMKLKQALKNTKSKPEPASILKQAISSGIISAVPGRRTELIKVTMKSENPQEAVKIIDAFINIYTSIQADSSTKEENQKLTRLEQDKQALVERLRDHHKKKQQLGQDYGSTKLDSRKEMMLELVKHIRTEITNLKFRKISLETQLKVLKESKEQPIAPQDVLRIRNEYITSDLRIQEITKKIVDLEENLLISKQFLAEGNPDLKQKEELLEMCRLQLEVERQRVGKAFDEMVAEQGEKVRRDELRRVQAELFQVKEHEKHLANELEKVDTSAIEIGRTQFKIDDLVLDQKFDEEAYEAISRAIRRLERELQEPARISVAYQAEIASIKDNRIKYTMALILGSMACGIMLAFLKDKADLRLRTPNDVVECIGDRIIGTTTSADSVKRSLHLKQLVGDYQAIRSNLRFHNGDNEPKMLVVTSPAMREGKTTFSINLATSMSKSGKKVLLIDGDLRKPDIARILDLPRNSRGLQDLLFGRKKYHQVICSTPISGLDVLSADSRNRDDAWELLAMPGALERVKTITQTYDHVIIDTPPLLAFPDALVWAKMADAVILTSFSGRTTAPDLKEAFEKLVHVNAKVIGTVLSNVNAGNSFYRYGQNYYNQNARSGANSKRTDAKLLLPSGSKT